MSKKSKIWYGYMEAGAKSSPVLMDPKLDTGDSKTLYIFNFSRNQIIEYQRSLIEPKLRELNGNESDMAEQLKKAFNKAVKDFTPRRSASKAIAETSASTKPPKVTEPDISDIVDDDIVIDDEIELDDDD